MVGRWGLKGNLDKNRDQVLAAGADRFATTLAETRRQLLTLTHLISAASDDGRLQASDFRLQTSGFRLQAEVQPEA